MMRRVDNPRMPPPSSFKIQTACQYELHRLARAKAVTDRETGDEAESLVQQPSDAMCRISGEEISKA
jgi:hypothetical protein